MIKEWITRISVVAALLFGGLFYITNQALEDEREISHARELVIEAQNRITEREQRVDRALHIVQRTVEEAPHAQDLIPPDIAAVHHDGIIRLRHDAGIIDDRGTELSGPGGKPSRHGRDDTSRPSKFLASTRSSISKM